MPFASHLHSLTNSAGNLGGRLGDDASTFAFVVEMEEHHRVGIP